MQPYGGLGAGLTVSRTEFEAFSASASQNDVSAGTVVAAGLQAPVDVSTGIQMLTLLEIQHRETSADLGRLGGAGEEMLAGTHLAAGVGVEF